MPAVPNAALGALRPAAVRKLLAERLRDHELIVPGRAAADPERQLLRRYPPRFFAELFGTEFFLSELRQDHGFSFFVALLTLPPRRGQRRQKRLYARIIYKDSSLIWRSATHYICSDNEHWVGKGEIRPVLEDGREVWYSAEETTNLPLELIAALDDASRRRQRVQGDDEALALVLRNAPDDRVEPYRDFYGPRERAAKDPARQVNGGRPVARFTDPSLPESLQFVAGFEPDFGHGLVDVSHARSTLYGGEIRKYRFVSTNRQIQYMVIAGPAQVWLIPPQTLATRLMSYGVREVDVAVPEALCLPGYEFHYLDESTSPPTLHSQLPAGFAGPPSPLDPDRADASPWNERLPVLREFRRTVLARDGVPAPA